MICNKEEAMCIAGVFGGLDSGSTETTKDVFLESAYFHPTWVRKTALTAVGNMIMSFRTAVAGKLDYVYKRWIVILFCDRTFFNAVSHRLMLLDRS